MAKPWRAAAFALAFTLLFLFTAPCGRAMDWAVTEEEALPPDPQQQARLWIREMTLEQKVYQMLFVDPEALTGESGVTSISDPSVFQRYPVGGVVLFGRNIVSEEQVRQLAAVLCTAGKKYEGFAPFIAVDEEGGNVSRIANKLGYPLPASPEAIGLEADAPSLAGNAGKEIAAYLTALGINMDFAPVADVLIREVAELDGRSYGYDVQTVADCAVAMAEALRQGGIIPCFKHFPGHGAVLGNSHKRSVSSRRTMMEMKKAELVPFSAAIAEGAEVMMVSHFVASGLGDDMPASMSARVIDGLLRDEMGFRGLVITDALRMTSVLQEYKETTAAVRAIQAGADMILLPVDMEAVANSILKAVKNGEITEQRIDESVARILGVKIQYGLVN